MLLDQLSTFAEEVSLVGATGTAKIGTALDIVNPRNIGWGSSANLEIRVGKTAVDSAADGATLGFQVVTADNEALTTNVVVLQTIAAIPQASLEAGALIHVGQVPLNSEAKRWIGLRSVRGGEAITAGTLNAHFTVTPRGWYGHTAATGASAQ